MEWMGRLRHRLRILTRKEDVERAMARELERHIEQETADRVRLGLSPEEALRSALIDFGALEAVKEDARDARGGRLLDDFAGDLRHGARLLARNPGFAAAAILTFALGSGAASAVLTVVDAILLQPLPYSDPSRLVVLWERSVPHSADRNVVSVGNFEAWRDRSRSFEHMAAVVPRPVTMNEEHVPEYLAGAEVSPGYFSMLGVAPAVGRDFGPLDAAPDGAQVAILSDALWRRMFGGDPGVVGHAVRLDGIPTVIVGVMPAGFTPPRFGWLGDQELWFPFRATSQNRTWGRFLLVVARLKRGVVLPDARGEMQQIAAGLARDTRDDEGWSVSIVPLKAQITGDVRAALVVILAAAALLLAIALTNVATLTTAFVRRRGHEIATRRALGATAARLRRQWIAHGALLALAGTTAAVPLGVALVRVFVSLAPSDVPRIDSVRIDPLLLVLATALPMAATMLLASTLALRPGSARVLGMRDGSDGAPRLGASRALVVVEISVALALGVAAVLMTRSFAHLREVDLGFEADGLLAARVALADSPGATPARTRADFESLLERIRGLPGVSSVALMSTRPFGGPGPATEVVDGRPGPEARRSSTVADVRYVGESLFRTLGVPLIRGRTLEARGGAAGFGEVVVSESLAAAVWPGEDPIGRTLHLDLFDGIDPTVVGTVRDIHLMDSRSAPRPAAYLSDEVVPSRTRDVILRARGDPESSILALRRALQKVDPQAPLYRVVTLPRLIAGAVSSDRFTTLLLLGFAILALVLSGVGVFGVISSDVGQRRREMAVRRALGALPTSLAAMLVRQALLRASLGVGVGAVLGLVLALSMRSLLFGVSPGDPWTFVGVSIGVEGVVVGATLLCAIPAVRRSPLATLREG